MDIPIRVAERVLDTLCQFYRLLYVPGADQVKALWPEIGFVDLLEI